MQVRDATISDAGGLARVQVDSYRSAYAGKWSEVVLDSLSYGEQEKDWRDWIRSNPEDLLYVAELSAGEVVGYAPARPSPTEILGYDSELIALHVLGPYHRQGLGRSLVVAIAKELQSRGSESLMLWVLKENRARGFYERLDGQLLAVKRKSWAGRPEVACGWPRSEVLCGQRWGSGQWTKLRSTERDSGP